MSMWTNIEYICFFLFAPLIPLVGVPGEGGEAGAAGGENAEGDEGKNTNLDGESNDGEKGQKQESTFSSQADFDKAFERRMARERKKMETEFNTKLEREKMDETQKAKAEKADAELKATEAIKKANSRLIKSEVNLKSVELGIIDAEAAYALVNKEDIDVDDHGNVTGIEAALKSLITRKPYLVKPAEQQHQKAGDDQSSSTKKNNFNINDMFRKAAGR